MKTPHLIHLSLGSNQGDRFVVLQKAIDTIYQEIGDVVGISKVYKTPAWGFESEDFYNACTSIHARFDSYTVLEKILNIEKKLGRQRTNNGGYEARVIDIDILLSSEGVFKTSNLTIPHPLMQDRKFVLQPLAEIAGSLVHPIFRKSISALLQQSADTATLTLIDKTFINPKEKYRFTDLQYLTIEGNIGVGKTSLSRMVAEEFNAKLVLERFADNPFLPKFYKDMERYAFPLEMSFLADRYQRLQDDIAQFDLFKDFVVSDYDVFKSLIFANVTLSSEEFKLYKKIFDIMYTEVPKPGLYVYLYQHTERLLENIQNRGRSYEKKIPQEYLDKIHKGYLQFIKSQSYFPIKIIDVSDRDFVQNRSDFIWILDSIVSK